MSKFVVLTLDRIMAGEENSWDVAGGLFPANSFPSILPVSILTKCIDLSIYELSKVLPITQGSETLRARL